jgi:hypothetical protein
MLQLVVLTTLLALTVVCDAYDAVPRESADITSSSTSNITTTTTVTAVLDPLIAHTAMRASLDLNDCKYSFQVSWKTRTATDETGSKHEEKRLWLDYDSKSHRMFCKACIIAGADSVWAKEGCVSIKLDSVMRHERVVEHGKAMTATAGRFEPQRCDTSQSTVALKIKALSAKVQQAMVQCFRLIYYNAKQEIATMKYRNLRELVTLVILLCCFFFEIAIAHCFIMICCLLSDGHQRFRCP